VDGPIRAIKSFCSLRRMAVSCLIVLAALRFQAMLIIAISSKTS